MATKFGASRNAAGNLEICGKPDYVRACCEASLQRLGVEYIDLYYQHRIDTTIPIEETVIKFLYYWIFVLQIHLSFPLLRLINWLGLVIYAQNLNLVVKYEAINSRVLLLEVKYQSVGSSLMTYEIEFLFYIDWRTKEASWRGEGEVHRIVGAKSWYN